MPKSNPKSQNGQNPNPNQDIFRGYIRKSVLDETDTIQAKLLENPGRLHTGQRFLINTLLRRGIGNHEED
jgi:hypothetical protein